MYPPCSFLLIGCSQRSQRRTGKETTLGTERLLAGAGGTAQPFLIATQERRGPPPSIAGRRPSARCRRLGPRIPRLRRRRRRRRRTRCPAFLAAAAAAHYLKPPRARTSAIGHPPHRA